MWILIVGLAVFLGMHSIAIVAPGARARAVQRFGEGRWKAVYGAVSLAGFWLIVHGFQAARSSHLQLYLYEPPGWMRHVTLVLMVPVFPLVFAAYLPGRIKTAAKQPMLAGVKLWALAHLLSNGTLADLLLFGGFLCWAVLDFVSLRRRPRPIPTAPPGRFNDLLAVVLGLGLYGLTLGWAHLRLIGVAPLG
jgi:uncharacterized membrane protein